MKAELFDRWVAALESGEYKQGRNRLATVVSGERRYCCLGVLCVVDGVDLDKRAYMKYGGQKIIRNMSGVGELPSVAAPALASIPENLRNDLATMNDNGHTFVEIADYLRRRYRDSFITKEE